MAGQVWESDSAAYITPRGIGQSDPWTAAGPGHTQQLIDVTQSVPPPRIAAMLGVFPGETAIVRRRVICLNDRPIEAADSWYPRHIAAGTDLATPKKIKGGAASLLDRLGHTIQTVTEHITAAAVGPDTAETLGINPGEPVLELTRISADAAGTTVEVAAMTMLAGTTLRYRTQV